ncbi:MAG: carboxymuconolactone decarboxylase family protein [Rhodospirillales bacterium]|jgi:4-carboxymuconolactone decarboxylase|nr:carboxymuconolactone decarboxylase family protein [Rhodospirillales bacterium]MDP6591116.1 carboxymuconolactone decarboxylase family protein [Alphaproteobacteria bacterium]MDP6843134.1 carboxymuconolactone decarboxylase family protein [Rhodospirillales bacterium]|tara:strand:+ start:861 stop:1421 length:561 start_codon:yes stop_codon:yes gene_type:complete
MSRIPLPEEDQLDDAQRRVYDDIKAGRRGAVLDLFMMLLHSPELADRAQRLGVFLRYETSLPTRLSELAVLTTAKHWSSSYEWHFHEKEALAGGLAAHIIAAVRSGNAPDFANADEAAVYAYTRETLTNKHASDETYNSALALFGNAGMVELTCLIGYYCMIALTLNEHGVPLPEGAEPALPPPGS